MVERLDLRKNKWEKVRRGDSLLKGDRIRTGRNSRAELVFKNKVYQNVIPRNVRLSEAPSHGIPVLIYDKSCPGSKSYFTFTDEFLNQDKVVESAA